MRSEVPAVADRQACEAVREEVVPVGGDRPPGLPFVRLADRAETGLRDPPERELTRCESPV
ncbi:hypothetical protein [Streptomyces anulatus]|uniref:hypothetical protein n=1 Tax=Streptomyces anulatus TaxID=1892 RepID=UPI001943F1CC|nr:hypothetical protein [Streptomyces anulatus]